MPKVLAGAMTRGRPGRIRGIVLGLVLLLLVPAGGSLAAHPSSPVIASPDPTPSGHLGAGVARDPMTAGEGVGRILVTNTDPAAVPNDGLRTELAGFKIDPFSGLSSLQVGAEEVLGGNLAVFGLFQNSPLGAYPFFSVFNNTTGLPVFQANESFTIATVGVGYDFALENSGGTNWTLDVNGQPFGGSPGTATLNFGVTASTQATGIAFSMIALSQFPVVPPSLLAYTALAVHQGGGWYLPTSANSTWRGAAAVEWGVAGAIQDPSLWPGELDLGTAVTEVPNGTILWSGGPRPASAVLASDPTTAFGGGTTLVSTRFSDAAGSIVDLPVEFRDSDGGSFIDANPLTDGNGSASTAYIAPNVTANATDQLTVASNILGVGAAASTSVSVTPAVEIRLGPVGTPTVAPDSTAGIEVRATSARTGLVAPGILLAVVLTGGGVVQPATGITDRAGDLTVNVTAPRASGVLTLTVVVSTPGYWGKARILVTDTVPAPSLLQELQGDLGWVIVGVVIALAVALYLRSRLPRTKLPAMDLRRRVPLRPPGPPPVGPSGPPPSTDVPAPPAADPPR